MSVKEQDVGVNIGARVMGLAMAKWQHRKKLW